MSVHVSNFDHQSSLAGTLFKDGVGLIFGFGSKVDFFAMAATCRYWYSIASVIPSLGFSCLTNNFDVLHSPLSYHIGELTSGVTLDPSPLVCRFPSRIQTLYLYFIGSDPTPDAVHTIINGLRQCTPMLQSLQFECLLTAEVNMTQVHELQSLTWLSLASISPSLNLDPLRTCTSLTCLTFKTQDRKVLPIMLKQLSQMMLLKTLETSCFVSVEDLSYLHPPALDTLLIESPSGYRPAPTYWSTLFRHMPGLTALSTLISSLEVKLLISSFAKLRELTVGEHHEEDRAKLNQLEHETEFAYAIRQLPSLTRITFRKWTSLSTESWNIMLPIGTSIQDLRFYLRSEMEADFYPLCNLSKSSAASQLRHLELNLYRLHQDLCVVMEYFRRLTSLRDLILRTGMPADPFREAFDDVSILPQLEHLEISNGGCAPFKYNRKYATPYRTNHLQLQSTTSSSAPTDENRRSRE